jgi:hypothetical protein
MSAYNDAWQAFEEARAEAIKNHPGHPTQSVFRGVALGHLYPSEPFVMRAVEALAMVDPPLAEAIANLQLSVRKTAE